MEDRLCQENRFQNLRQFFRNFTLDLEVFDPLDRPIKNSENEDQAVKREKLLEKIIQMPLVEASKLQLPISNRCLILLQNLFKIMQDNCNEVAKKCIKTAKEGSSKDQKNADKQFIDSEII